MAIGTVDRRSGLRVDTGHKIREGEEVPRLLYGFTTDGLQR